MAVSLREIMNLPEERPITTVLVVDRGDGALRVLRGLREAGVASVLLSGAGTSAPERAVADRVVPAPGLPLDARRPADRERLVQAIVDAADEWRAEAVHFGYAVAGQHAGVVAAVERAGLVVLGPTRGALEAIEARAAELAAAAGLRYEPDRTGSTVSVVVAVDEWGSGIALGDRDSIRRGDGRVLGDTSPSRLAARRRERLGREAVRLAVAAGLKGVATVELAVEGGEAVALRGIHGGIHPGDLVVEEVAGVELVAEQLRLAGGLPISLHADRRRNGAAIQCRILAIDPTDGHTADRGVVRGLRLPNGAGVRVEPKVGVGAALEPGDPVIARVACHGRDRQTATRRLDAALAETAVLGVRTNVPLLRALLSDEALQDDPSTCPDAAVSRAARRIAEPDREAEAAVAALLAVHAVRARPAGAATRAARWVAQGRVLDMGGV